MAVPRYGEAAGVLGDQRECFVRGPNQGRRAAFELVTEAALGRREQQALVGEPRGLIDAKFEPGQVADRLGADADLTIGGDSDWKRVGAARADITHENCGATVD